MEKSLRILFLLFCQYLLLNVVSAVKISNCATLTDNGYYILGKDIFFTSSECIKIENVSFMIFDCNNHSFSSSFSGTAILIHNSSNVHISNCNFYNSTTSINITNGVNITINKIYDYNSTLSLYLEDVNSTNIFDISLEELSKGIYAMKSNNLNISYLSIKGLGNENGIKIDNSNEINVSHINISSFSYGIIVNNTQNMKIFNNNISYNTYGICTKNSNYITVYNNLFINDVNFQDDGSSNIYLSISKDCTQKAITKAPCIGGNFWGNSTKTDFSDTCNDTNGDGFCDNSYTIGSLTDSLPLSPYIFINVKINPTNYDVNSTEEFIIKGNAKIMPYLAPYDGDVSVYLSSSGFIKNISSNNGNIYDSFIHPANSYDKQAYLIGYNASYISNNTYYLMPRIFTLGIKIKGGVPVERNSVYKYSLIMVNNLYIFLLPTLFKSETAELYTSEQGLKVDPSMESIIMGVFHSYTDSDALRNRISLFYENEYCTFSFGDIINKKCNVVIPIYSELPLMASFKSIGEGNYVFILKRLRDSISLSLK